MNGRAWLLLANLHLELTGVSDFAAIDLRDYVAYFQTGFRSRSIRLYLRYHGSARFGHIEELGVLRRDIGNANAHVGVSYFPISDQLVNGWANDLGWNRKSHSRKGTGGRDEEGIDADDLAVRIDQRSAGVARVDSSIGLNEFS